MVFSGCLSSEAGNGTGGATWQDTMEDAGLRTDYSEARRIAVAEDKPLLLYFGSPNCHWCQKFHEEILTDRGVREAMDSYVPVAVKMEGGSPLIERYAVTGTPTVVLVEPQSGKPLGRLTGYPNAEDPAGYFANWLNSSLERNGSE